MKAHGNQVVLPLNVAKIIDENDPVFKMAELLGELDYRKLRRTYRRHWRSISPEIMFSVIVFANMKGIYSSRGIEEASLMKEFYNLQRCSANQEFYAFNPKCIVVIGSLATMNADGLSAFENYRNSLSNIEIIAFDEVLQRLKDLRSILEEDTSAQ